MIKTVKQACRFNAVIHDYRMSQGIENLAELIRDEGDGREFFSRNFVTHGMAQLFREGLLRNTVVVILGDHGRHEPVGSTDIERKAGHFASPLFIWMDESLRTPATYRPRPVSVIASQVDLAPTLLALNGGLPAIGSFAGHDLSCVLVRDCLPNQVAYLTSVYDNLVGLASAEGLLLYSFATAHFQEATLNFEPVSDEQTGQRQLSASRDRELMALYEVANVALDSNRLWSWREFGTRL